MNEKKHRQIRTGLICIWLIVMISVLTGCVDENTQTPPTEKAKNTPEPTITPTPTPVPTPTPTPTPIPLKSYEELPYLKANGEPITLINYRDSTKPTFKELRKFIENDRTDEETYNEYSYICGDFAEQVHNNAEAQGIKAGLAFITFKNNIVGHAINVFDTKDYGRVYIDCTGEGLFIPEYNVEYFCDPILTECSNDKIAYIEKGKEYGTLSFNVVSFNTDYKHYEVLKDNGEDFIRDIDAYNKEMREYNIEMGRFNRDVDYYNSLPSVYYDDESYRAAMELYNELEDRERELDSLSTSLNIKKRSIENREETYCCVWESLGIVEDIEIYW